MKTQKIQIQGLNMKNNTNIQINKILELFTNIIIMNSQKKKVKKQVSLIAKQAGNRTVRDKLPHKLKLSAVKIHQWFYI